MDCHFRDLPDFQSSEARLMTASAVHAPTQYQHSTSYKEISVPMTCLDCKSLLGKTRITEHNTRSIYGRPQLSLIVPRKSGNRENPENDSPYSLNKKEWICSLFKEWILEKSEIRVNLEWIWSAHLCYSLIHSGIPSDPWGHSKMSE